MQHGKCPVEKSPECAWRAKNIFLLRLGELREILRVGDI
jgi:hypothetical protein